MSLGQIIVNIAIYAFLTLGSYFLYVLFYSRFMDGNPKAKSIFCRWGLQEPQKQYDDDDFEVKEVCKICNHTLKTGNFYHAFLQNFEENDSESPDAHLVR